MQGHRATGDAWPDALDCQLGLLLMPEPPTSHPKVWVRKAALSPSHPTSVVLQARDPGLPWGTWKQRRLLAKRETATPTIMGQPTSFTLQKPSPLAPTPSVSCTCPSDPLALPGWGSFALILIPSLCAQEGSYSWPHRGTARSPC